MDRHMGFVLDINNESCLNEILFFIDKSKVRLEVFLILGLMYPDGMIISNIVNLCRSNYNNVMGAIKGNGESYCEKTSLMGMGLVVCDYDAIRYHKKYTLTSSGYQIFNIIRSDKDYNDKYQQKIIDLRNKI